MCIYVCIMEPSKEADRKAFLTIHPFLFQLTTSITSLNSHLGHLIIVINWTNCTVIMALWVFPCTVFWHVIFTILLPSFQNVNCWIIYCNNIKFVTLQTYCTLFITLQPPLTCRLYSVVHMKLLQCVNCFLIFYSFHLYLS